MELLIKVAVFSAIGALCAMMLKNRVPEIGMMITILVSAVVAFMALGIFGEIMAFLDEVAKAAGIDTAFLSPVYKLIGIGVVTKLTADACRDAHETAVASTIELFGMAAGIYITIPLIRTLLDLVKGLL